MKNLLLYLGLLLVFGVLAEERIFVVEIPSIELSAAQSDREASGSNGANELEFSVPADSDELSQAHGPGKACHQTSSYLFETCSSHAIRAPPASRA